MTDPNVHYIVIHIHYWIIAALLVAGLFGAYFGFKTKKQGFNLRDFEDYFRAKWNC